MLVQETESNAGSTNYQGAEDFARLTAGYRTELLAHCYRMLGSIHDAEDLVQETYLRAWRASASFEGRSSLRAWLYRIATNTCLTAIRSRSRRPLPSGLGGPSDDPEARPQADLHGIRWLEPFPDSVLGAGAGVSAGAGTGLGAVDPADIVQARGSVRLALVAAMQHLSARERAALILREVAQFPAAETADILGVSVAAVNSALQRARIHLAQASALEEEYAEPAEPECRALLDRYVTVFETADLAALPELLRADALLEMPPSPTWFDGRPEIVRFLAAQCFRAPGANRMLPISANGQPAVASYLLGPDGRHHAQSIQVLTVADGLVAGIVAFLDTGLFPTFGLPTVLDTDRR